jgi:lipoprotein-anchoring transpeptidase ErfK/SrfK
MMASAKLPALGYTNELEALAEKFHSSQTFLRRLNPGASWKAGEVIKVPDVEPFDPSAKPAAKPAPPARGRANTANTANTAKPAAPSTPGVEVVLNGATKSLVVREPGGRILMHAPMTSGSEHDPLPIGEWKVTGVSWNPTFNYNPDLFWDANPTHSKAKIPPGPNNPVGIVWVDINKEHFGLHGTPEPSTIGRTESHGCVRLTNWDAMKLGRLVSPGTKVTIQ